MTEGAVPSEPQRQLIVFSLHGERYGLPIACVREIIRYTPPRVTATARGLIQGMINLRGRVLPVLDLSSRLGRTLEVSSSTRILVIEVSTGVVALIVNTVEGVIQVATDRIEDIPGAPSNDALGHQVAAIGDQLIMLIDPDRALGSALSPRRMVNALPRRRSRRLPTALPRGRHRLRRGGVRRPPRRFRGHVATGHITDERRCDTRAILRKP